MTPAERLDKEFNKIRAQLDYLCEGMKVIMEYLLKLKNQGDDSNDESHSRDNNGDD